jgi:hypothetical protein
MTSGNAKPKRPVSRRMQTMREIEAIDPLLAIEYRENEASYLSRGRHLKPLDGSALQRMWADCVIRELARTYNTELQDVCAELLLRGMLQAALSPDLMEWMAAEVEKIIVPERGDTRLA